MIRFQTEGQLRQALNGKATRRGQNKYNATPTHVDSIRFPSKREAEAYKRLRAAKNAGEFQILLRQVPLQLPGGTILRLDFVTIGAEALKHIRFIDAKGFETDSFRIKRREVEHHLGIKIELV